MSTPVPPPRIYGVMARAAPVCVLFRRGPSRRVQVIRWDTSTDEFQFGQWLKGRIYETMTDLSPNGELMVYHGGNMRFLKASKGIWTAVSKPPYLTALAWFPQVCTWGGGVFLSNDRLYVYGSIRDGRIEQGCPLHIEEYDHAKEKTAEKRSNDWITVSNIELASPSYSTYSLGIREKIAVGYVLRRTEVRGESRVATYEVLDDEGNTVLDLRAGWADVDQRGRIVFAREGKIYAVEGEGKALPGKELVDLSDNKFEPMEAPEWARRW